MVNQRWWLMRVVFLNRLMLVQVQANAIQLVETTTRTRLSSTASIEAISSVAITAASQPQTAGALTPSKRRAAIR